MTNSITRRSTLKALAAASTLTASGLWRPAMAAQPIKVGFLSGMTGLETILGETQLNCFKLAIEEVNAANTAGRPLEFVVEDDQTSTKGAIDKARKLITQDKADVIIGLIASLTHVAARSVTKPAKEILIYTTYYEGAVCEPTFFSTGQVPNQQITKTAEWLVKNVGKTVYIAGSDYIWPKASAEVIKTTIESLGGKVLGAEFFPFGSGDFGPLLNRINAAKPDIVWTMFAGSDSVSMRKQYRSFGIKSQVVAHGLDDVFARAEPAVWEGTITNQAYFMSIDNPKNTAFKAAYKAKFGDKPINAIGEAAYDAVWLYALAVAKAGSTESDKVVPALKEVKFDAPQGTVNFAANNVMRSNSILAKSKADGSFDIIENYGQIDPAVPGCKL